MRHRYKIVERHTDAVLSYGANLTNLLRTAKLMDSAVDVWDGKSVVAHVDEGRVTYPQTQVRQSAATACSDSIAVTPAQAQKPQRKFIIRRKGQQC